MPIQEAKACGVPSLVMDYTAMREKGRYPDYEHFKQIGVTEDTYSCHLGGDIINVDRYYYEPETSCKRALPDIDDLAKKMRDMLVDNDRRKRMSADARKCVEQNYDWNQLWKQWEFVFDKITPKDRSETWDSPIIVKSVYLPTSIPDGLDDNQFIEWLYLQVLRYPQVDPQGAAQWLYQMKSGATREQLFQQFKSIATAGEDGENVRQRIRAAIAKQRGEAYIDETATQKESEWI